MQKKSKPEKKKKSTGAAGSSASLEKSDESVKRDFDLTQCWLRCDKCGARRLVSRACMAALTTEAYQKDWREEGEKGRIDDMCGAFRWRDWLGGASARYQRWLGVTQSGERPGRAGLAAVEEAECDRGDAVDTGAPDHVSP